MNELTRRRFLQTTGGALLAAPVAGDLVHPSAGLGQQVPPPPGRQLGWALVGLGNLSINQLMPAFALTEKSKLTAFVSGSPEKARTLALRYGVSEQNIYNYENYERIAGNPDIDIVYIVLPNSMHAEYTIRALKAGKHVLCEKPMANTVEECEQMIGAARQADRRLMIAYRLQYEPFNQTMIRMARDQEFGPVKVVVADNGFNIGDPKQWRLQAKMAGGGSLMDIGIYALQATRYITGEEPTEVSAMMYSTPGDPRFREVEENITFQLRFPGGALANCTSSYGAPMNRYRVFAPKGSFELDPAISYTGLRMFVYRGNTVEERRLPQRNHFALQMDHFSECVIEGREPLTPGEEGLEDIRIMMAIYEAARAGGAVKL
jgi:predicted dehydrogenase